MKNRIKMMVIIIVACIVMGFVDAWIQPGYIIKSLIKVGLFLGLPFLWSLKNSVVLKNSLQLNMKTFKNEVLMGILVYLLIVGGYLCLKDVFDFSNVTESLNQTTGVNPTNFIFVALYISLMNSWLEEFFFRGFAYLSFAKQTSNQFATHFSALMFALYHVAMMIGWFDGWMIFLAIIGLYIGGLLFNHLDNQTQTIYPSWMVHICANLAINTVGCILFKII